MQFRASFLTAFEAVFDLMYLLGEVFVHFQRISEGLGDYGMIRMARWLHPFLNALTEKVQTLKNSLESVKEAVDQELVIKPAKTGGRNIKKPWTKQVAWSDQMRARAHGSIERAITGPENHAQMLVQVLHDLRTRSKEERLPQLVESLGDAYQQLQGVLFSSQFRARVGGNFPDLPALGSGTPATPTGSARVIDAAA